MDPSEIFKNYAAGAQSYFMIAGLILGGIWTIRNFNLLHAPNIAKAQLKELEKKLEEWGEIQTKVVALQVESVNANEFLVVALFEFTNPGTQTVTLDVKEYPCSISEVIFDDSGHPRTQNSIYCHFIAPAPFANQVAAQKFDTFVVEPKGILNLSSAFRVTNPGLYLVGCSIKASTPEDRLLDNPIWSGFTYISIK